MAGIVLLPETLLCRNVEYGGAYRIAGTVNELGVNGSYRVRLYKRQNGEVIAETWSASNGSYAFNYLANISNGYFVVAHDHTTPLNNAAIADLITPEPMP